MAEQEPNTTVSCSGCGAAVPEPPGWMEDRGPCPTCGSTARTFAVTLTDKAEAHDSLATMARHGDVGKVKPYREAFSGFDYHRDTGSGARSRGSSTGRATATPSASSTRPGTSSGMFDEPLSQHWGRGAAKRRPPTDPTP